jgi:hypothetical protein
MVSARRNSGYKTAVLVESGVIRRRLLVVAYSASRNSGYKTAVLVESGVIRRRLLVVAYSASRNGGSGNKAVVLGQWLIVGWFLNSSARSMVSSRMVVFKWQCQIIG